ncbi:MAG: site-specific integrase [Sphingomonas bacterium]|nr:site-specific integrase [Sphingomonas bacterium]
MASIRKRGERWLVQVRREGFPPISKTFDLKSDAQKFARAFERDIDRGEVVPAERRQITTTVAELLDRYEQTETARKRGAKDEIAHMKAIRRHAISKCNLACLTAVSVAGYRDDRLQCVSASTVRREMGILLHCLRLAAREWGMPVQEKAYSTVARPKEGRARQRRVSFEEIDALLSECDRRSPPYMKPAIILAIETGMRRGELLSLTWDDIDRRRDLARLHQTKNGEPRLVPLSPVARPILRDLPHSGDRIFAVTPNAFRMTWERIKKRAGVPDLRFHDLRHEAVSRLFEANLSLPEVALISGHKDPRMLLRYTHLKPEDVARKLGRGRGAEKDHDARREVLRKRWLGLSEQAHRPGKWIACRV